VILPFLLKCPTTVHREGLNPPGGDISLFTARLLPSNTRQYRRPSNTQGLLLKVLAIPYRKKVFVPAPNFLSLVPLSL